MDRYIIHLVREKITSWNVAVEFQDREVTITYRTSNSQLKIPYIDEYTNPGEMDVWYCDELQHAELLAEQISRHNPGRNVNIYLLQSVTKCNPTKPTRAKFTEKGLVPS